MSFLGVDEGVRPDAFEQLVALFERRPDVDWAQGYALVTEVDENGTHMRDIFPHRRSTESQNIHYLECCHIGYVGAAYRRDLHTRFGMYDPTFRAAGDNEFKNRILPFIKVMTIPEIFGTFYNYPELARQRARWRSWRICGLGTFTAPLSASAMHSSGNPMKNASRNSFVR